MKRLERIPNGSEIDDMICLDCNYSEIRKTAVYLVKCKICGRKKIMLPNTIHNRVGTTHKSCGKGLKIKNPRFYSEWKSMRTRTTNPNYEHYKDYGGRGISSEKFKYFIDFYDRMYDSYIEACEKYGEKNVSLDRKDFNGDYEKDNCQWIHIKDQAGNTRKTIIFEITFPDGTKKIFKNVNATCREYGWNPSSMKSLLQGRMKSYKGLKGKRIN